jgi:Flp pilus assembly protein TadG
MRQRNRRAAGQGLVEFALVIPVFLLVFMGLVDGGRLIYVYNTVSNAARSGARVAVVNQSTSGTQTCDTTSTAYPAGCAASAAIGVGVSPSDVIVTYRSWNDSGACSPMAMGCLAVVTVTGRFQPLTPIIGQLIGVVTLQSTTMMPVERVCSTGC